MDVLGPGREELKELLKCKKERKFKPRSSVFRTKVNGASARRNRRTISSSVAGRSAVAGGDQQCFCILTQQTSQSGSPGERAQASGGPARRRQHACPATMICYRVKGKSRIWRDRPAGKLEKRRVVFLSLALSLSLAVSLLICLKSCFQSK